MKKLKYPKDIPTFEDIQKEIHKKGYHGNITRAINYSQYSLIRIILLVGLTTLICFTAIFFNKQKEYADAVNFISDSEECEKIRTIVFNNPEYGKVLAENLLLFVESGHF